MESILQPRCGGVVNRSGIVVAPAVSVGTAAAASAGLGGVARGASLGVVDDDTSEGEDSEQGPWPAGANAGMGIAIGAGVGAALFAVTSSPVWIAIGVALGAAIGTANNSRN
jgi:hypothetical protein